MSTVTASPPESLPLTPRDSAELSRSQTPPARSNSDDSQSALPVEGEGPGEGEALLRRYGDQQDAWEDEHEEEEDDDWDQIPPSPSTSSSTNRKKHKNRRVYGGGRHAHSAAESEAGGGRTTTEVAGMILASTLSPCPLLIPHAVALLGLPLFLPLTIIIAALSWFAYITLGVEARYVGSRSYPSLASAVFPHRFHLSKLGSLLASLLVGLGSLTRGVLGAVAAAEVIVELLLPVLPPAEGAPETTVGARRLAVAVIGFIWVLAPLLLLPLLRRHLSTRPSALSTLLRLPAWLAILLWPLAITVLGIRIGQLDLEGGPDWRPGKRGLTFPPPPSPGGGDGEMREAMGLSIWGGICLLLLSLSAHHDTFKFFTSLSRPSSLSLRSSSLPFSSSSNPNREREAGAKRNQWPLATFLGLAGSLAILLPWALVPYLLLPNGGREGNLLASPHLPIEDPWLALVRWLVFTATIAQLEGSLGGAYGRVARGIEVVAGRRGSGEQEGEKWDWRAGVARSAVWVVVSAVGWVVCGWGEKGEGMVSMAEMAGALLCSLTGFLIPSLFFIALFHLRRPRSIFISDPSSADALLLRKEREVQRRLSGRRFWQDVLVFGGLLPFGVIVLVRGCVALVRGGD